MPLTIDIVSDHVCPWCFIGKRRLDRALAERPDIDVEISWYPFQLTPDMPREGRDRLEHMHSIFGEERTDMILGRLGEAGREDGIEFQYKPGSRASNTLAAHVLMHWAQWSPDIDQHVLAERIFVAYFVDCEDIGDLNVLAGIGAEVGMNRTEVADKLEQRVDEALVTRLIAQSHTRGISGAPLYVFNNQYTLSGAQPVEVLLQLFDKAGDVRVG